MNECDLWDAGYAGFTCRHLHQCVDEGKYPSFSIGGHFRDSHGLVPKDLMISKNLSTLKKCKNKFDCLIFEMFFVDELKPTL